MRSTLPAALTPLVGREPDIIAIEALLDQPNLRLVSLTGPGGVGKTALALEVGRRVRDRFADGAVFVPLATVRDADFVAAAILQALAGDAPGRQPAGEQLVAQLQDRQLLLILDNFEQILPAAPLVSRLLAGCPDLSIIVTSRAALRLTGEHLYLVEPLPVPSIDQPATIEDLARIPSVQLFVDRAQAVQRGFVLTQADAASIAAISRRLDGLPLAIQLAAPWVRIFSPERLLAALDDRLALLTAGPRDAPERLRTMRDAIAWSDDLLSPPLRQLYRQLSIFSGGWTLDAAAAVVDPSIQQSLDDGLRGGLAALVDHSLVLWLAGQGREPRFRMLETIREYGLEQLTLSAELEETRSRHAAWCMTVLDQFERGVASSGYGDLLAQTEVEHDNIRAALGWLLDAGHVEQAQRMVGLALNFWVLHNHYSEGRIWAGRALAADDGSNSTPDAQAAALLTATALALMQGDVDEGDQLNQRILGIWQSLGDRQGIGVALFAQGFTLLNRGENDAAAERFEGALARFRKGKYQFLTLISLNHLGFIAYQRGDIARAERLLEESLSLCHQLGDRWETTLSLTNLARIARDRGDYARAAALYGDALGLHRRFGEKTMVARTLRNLAKIAGLCGMPSQAARLYSAAGVIRDSVGATIQPDRRSDYEQDLAAIRSRLTGQEFATAWDAGQALTIEQAVAEGIAMAATLAQFSGGAEELGPSASQPGLPSLSPRELDVVRLLVDGLTDREIAEALEIGRRTASGHVTNILNKLGLNTRTAVAAYAVRHDLV